MSARRIPRGCTIAARSTAASWWCRRREPDDRTRIAYPELGLAVEHRRVEALDGALMPDWLAEALAESD